MTTAIDTAPDKDAPITGRSRPRSTGELSAAVRAVSDQILFTDAAGVVLAANAEARDNHPKKVIGVPFWQVLNLKSASLDQTLANHPLGRVHSIPAANGTGTWSLRIISLPNIYSPRGYVVLATDNRPLQKLQDTYRERIGENIQALDNSIRLFDAMFDGIQDAMLLLDQDHLVHAANPKAMELLDPDGLGLIGRKARSLFSPEEWERFNKKLSTLKDGGRQSSRRNCLTTKGCELPVDVMLWRIDLEGFTLFHMALRDLTAQTLLEKGLRRKKAEVEGMSLALRNVVRSTEQEKREMRRNVLRELQEDILPALERMAHETTPELRDTLKTMIRERIQEMAAGPSQGLSPLLLKLTPREIEVCKLIRLGTSTRDIAELLHASFETVQTHRKNIRRKLGLQGRQLSLFSFLHQQELLE
jgi:PAS domain S-box-containing protein